MIQKRTMIAQHALPGDASLVGRSGCEEFRGPDSSSVNTKGVIGADGIVARGMFALGRFVSEQLALWNYNVLECLPQRMFPSLEHLTYRILKLWNVCPNDFSSKAALFSGITNHRNISLEES